MVTVYFPKYLRELTDGVAHQKFDSTDSIDLMSGIRTLFPKLAMYLTGIESRQITNLCFFVDKNTKKMINNSLSNRIDAT